MGGFVERPGAEKDASSYKCLRCQYLASVFVKGIPYCDSHRPDRVEQTNKPEATTTTGGSKMADKGGKTDPTEAKVTETISAETVVKEGNWIVRAKDGTELRSGFTTKKEASRWALSEINSKNLKAGQYKIVSKAV